MADSPDSVDPSPSPVPDCADPSSTPSPLVDLLTLTCVRRADLRPSPVPDCTECADPSPPRSPLVAECADRKSAATEVGNENKKKSDRFSQTSPDFDQEAAKAALFPPGVWDAMQRRYEYIFGRAIM